MPNRSYSSPRRSRVRCTACSARSAGRRCDRRLDPDLGRLEGAGFDSVAGRPHPPRSAGSRRRLFPRWRDAITSTLGWSDGCGSRTPQSLRSRSPYSELIACTTMSVTSPVVPTRDFRSLRDWRPLRRPGAGSDGEHVAVAPPLTTERDGILEARDRIPGHEAIGVTRNRRRW